jgi:hypothetical protein
MWETVETVALEADTRTVREVLVEAYGEKFDNGSNSYLFDVVDTSRVPRASIVISGAMANDRHGYDDAVSVSNYRTLEDAWGHLEGFHRGAYMNCDSVALELDSVAPDDLLDVLEALADYPVLDESLWSEVEQEMIVEHWESYGRRDALKALATALEVDYLELSDNAREAVELLTFSGGDFGLDYPQFIDSSAVEFNTAEVVQFIIEHENCVVEAMHARGFTVDLTNLVESA